MCRCTSVSPTRSPNFRLRAASLARPHMVSSTTKSASGLVNDYPTVFTNQGTERLEYLENVTWTTFSCEARMTQVYIGGCGFVPSQTPIRALDASLAKGRANTYSGNHSIAQDGDCHTSHTRSNLAPTVTSAITLSNAACRWSCQARRSRI